MKFKDAILWLTKPYYGSNRLSRWIRDKIEGKSIQEIIGIPLVGAAFFGAVIVPQTQAGVYSTEVYFDTQRRTTIDAVVAPARFRWPLEQFGISTHYSAWHTGMDMTNPAGTPIYPVTEGTVTHVAHQYDGYGKHVIVTHDDGMRSTYAHLSRTIVSAGDPVTKNTELGTVGATGWATGNHLHLEIHQNNTPINPIEILPDIEKVVR